MTFRNKIQKLFTCKLNFFTEKFDIWKKLKHKNAIKMLEGVKKNFV